MRSEQEVRDALEKWRTEYPKLGGDDTMGVIIALEWVLGESNVLLSRDVIQSKSKDK